MATYDDILFKGTEPIDTNNDKISPKDVQRLRALDRAWNTRNFEIELYWKRALYFWGFIAIAGAGYFSENNDGENEYRLLIACVGLVFSFAWYLANKASKFWQENWEAHIDCLEDGFEGRLYKTVMSKNISLLDPTASYPLSVSKLNQLISLSVVLVWSGLIITKLPWVTFNTSQPDICDGIIFIITLFVFLIILLKIYCRFSETGLMRDNPKPFNDFDKNKDNQKHKHQYHERKLYDD